MAAFDGDNGDELAYLQPDFDLNTLTVPRLRSILVNHDISYPASAKKAQLITILENEVIPKARKILRERERVRRTSKGITNMPNNNTLQPPEDDVGGDGATIPPTTPSTTTARRGRSRPSTRASTATSVSEADEEPRAPTSARKRTGRSTSTKHPRASDTETIEEEVLPSIEGSPRKTPGRKSRKSQMHATPHAAGSRMSEDTVPRTKRESSAFTDDNPFQSGSSPLGETTPRPSTGSSDRRRKSSRQSGEIIASKEERRRRKTSEPVHVKQEDGYEVPTRSTFEVPVSRLETIKPEESSEEDELEAGEEFSPGEQLALEDEDEEEEEELPLTRQHSGGNVASWIVILTLFGAFAAWWRQEKVEIGYCGVGKPRWSLVDTNVPDWADVLEPRCEACPQHAFCYPNFEAKCEPDFVLKPHPLSVGGLVPVPPTCEPDGEKVRRVKVVADKAIEELRERRAKWECGEDEKGDGGDVKSSDMSVSELKEQVNKLRRKGMTDDEFEELWRGALGELSGREEVISTQKGPSTSPVLHLSSTSLAHLSVSCAIRRHLRLSLLAYRLPLLVLGFIISSALYARSRVLARRADAARVPTLVGMTLDRLATQAALHSRGDAREPWIPVGQLRDDVLRDELHGTRRENLWKRVRTVVEGNANVRAAVREGRGGDVSRVWEWIGGISGIEWDGTNLDSSRRESGRVRFLGSGPGAESDTSGLVRRPERANMEVRKWDEGRPIY